MSEISPTARALRALDILQGRPGITAAELAQRLGVTERAARRYVAILREADIPVESTRGPYGGYTLGRGLRLPPLVFSATEALGLVMAALDSQHAVADPDDPVGSALGKILRVLPSNVARQAVALRETARAVPERFPAKPDADRDHRAGGGGRRAAPGAPRLPHRRRQRADLRGRPVVGGGPLRPVVPALPLPPRRRAAHLPDRPDHRGARSSTAPSRCPPTSTPRPSSRPTSARAGSTRPTSCSTRRSPRSGRGSGPRSATCARGPRRVRAGGHHQQRGGVRRRVAGRRPVRRSRWWAATSCGRRWRRVGARLHARPPAGQRLTATSLPRVQPSEIGR